MDAGFNTDRKNRNAISRADMLTRTLLLAIVLNTPTINAHAIAEDAEAAYHERYHIVGELVRATAVCASSVQDAKWFLKGIDAITSPELRAFTKSFKKTTAAWMKSGGESFNDKVMSDGIPAACAFARTERARALKLANEPVVPKAPAPETNEDDYEDHQIYNVVFTGACKFKMFNRDQFQKCDPQVTFTNYEVHRSSFEFTGNDGKVIFVFEGGTEHQPDLQNYFLTINKIKIGTVTDGKIEGVQGPAEGECHMRQNADASEFYDIKCDVFTRKQRVVYNFYLTSITKFEKHP